MTALNPEILTRVFEVEGLHFFTSPQGTALLRWGASTDRAGFDLLVETLPMAGGFSMLVVQVEVEDQPRAPVDLLAAVANAWNASNRWPNAFVDPTATPARLIGQFHVPVPDSVTLEHLRWLVRLAVICADAFATMIDELAAAGAFSAADNAPELLLDREAG